MNWAGRAPDFREFSKHASKFSFMGRDPDYANISKLHTEPNESNLIPDA